MTIHTAKTAAAKKKAVTPTRKKAPAAITAPVAVTAPEPTVLVLRTCNSDMSAYNSFVWPTSGAVECPDWDPAPRCGAGLHGFLWGEGDGDLASWDADAKWLVVEVLEKDIVQLDGKVKFPRGSVVFCGDRAGATALIQRPGRAVIGGSIQAGTRGTATAGDYGTATAGDYGTATAGDYGTATAGTRGTATAGYGGTATAGEGGTATAGYGGTATAGYGGTAAAGYGGTATAGEGGCLEITRWDSTASRRRRVIGYVGEGGIRANVAYMVDETTGKLVEKVPSK